MLAIVSWRFATARIFDPPTATSRALGAATEDEIESAMLDVLQRQIEFSDRQLAYLELMEKLCPDL
jgi:hypothetical protein